MPNTSSPGRNRVTFLPTASTRPGDVACRGPASSGARSPKPTRRIRYGRPVMRCQAPRSTPAAWTRTQHLVVPDLGLVDLREPQDVGRAVAVLDDRLHRASRRRDVVSPGSVRRASAGSDVTGSCLRCMVAYVVSCQAYAYTVSSSTHGGQDGTQITEPGSDPGHR